MAGSVGTTCYVWPNGSDNNGGAFSPGGSGTDYSQSATPILAVTDGVTNGTTTVTSATGGFTLAMVDNYINIAGTCYQIKTLVNTNTITIDRTASSATGQTMKVGGALASPGMAAKLCADCSLGGGYVNIIAGTYTYTTNTQNVSGGRAVFSGGTVNGQQLIVQGYTSIPSDALTALKNGVKPVTFTVGAAGNSTYVLTAGPGVVVRNIAIDCKRATQTSWWGISLTNSRAENCSVDNAFVFSFNASNSSVVKCSASGNLDSNGAITLSGSEAIDCVVKTSLTAFGVNNSCFLTRCDAIGTATGSGINNSSASDASVVIDQCRIYNFSSAIRRAGGSRQTWTIANTLLSTNAVGITSTLVGASNFTIQNVAFWNNTTNVTAGIGAEVVNQVVLSADPFVSATGGDLRITPTAKSVLDGAGAIYPSSWLQYANGGVQSVGSNGGYND